MGIPCAVVPMECDSGKTHVEGGGVFPFHKLSFSESCSCKCTTIQALNLSVFLLK